MINFNSKTLSDIMRKTLEQRKVNPDSIHHVVSALVQTSLRGVDSHGINLFPHYCKAVDVERINKNPSMVISQPGESVAIIDADDGFGHHAGAVAMDKAVELSKKTGIGAASVKNSTHFAAAAYYGLRAAERDCIGFAFTNANALVKTFGAKEAFFGTNPICFTAPMEREEPFCLDMATSVVSWNKINNYRRENKNIPKEWAYDASGNPTTDPSQVKTINPIGDYKGCGLGMMIDILCGVLAGGPASKDILPMYPPKLDSTKRRLSHFFMAIDIDKFIGVVPFKKNLQRIVDEIRAAEPVVAGQEVVVAGDPEKRSFTRRLLEGIPVDDAKYEEFLVTSPEFSKAVI